MIPTEGSLQSSATTCKGWSQLTPQLQSGADGQTVRLHQCNKRVIQIYPLAKPTMQDGEKDGMKTSHFLHQSHRVSECHAKSGHEKEKNLKCRRLTIVHSWSPKGLNDFDKLLTRYPKNHSCNEQVLAEEAKKEKLAKLKITVLRTIVWGDTLLQKMPWSSCQLLLACKRAPFLSWIQILDNGSCCEVHPG